MGTKIAYVMSRFPHLPETFILREMNEIEQHGWDVALYPLIKQQQDIVHAEAKSWIPRARYLPFFSGDVLMANLRALFKRPGRYLSIWGKAFAENLSSPNLLVRAVALIPKAVYAAELMQNEGVQHIHAHYATHPAFVAWVIHSLTGINYSITVHAHDIFVRTAMMGTKMKHAQFIAAISNFNREYLGEKLGAWVKEKIHIVHCGILPEKYQPQERSWQVGDRFEIITTGSLQPYKGQKYLVEACAILRDKGIPFRCRFIGGGEEYDDLAQRIADHNLEECVILLGSKTQDEVAELLATAHCYTQPSIITPSGKMEGIPVALMEAMAGQLPVLATELSGIPELVRPGETGYLVPPADTAALAEALEKIYNAPEEAAQRAAAGRQLVLDEFELRDNVKQLSALFERFIER